MNASVRGLLAAALLACSACGAADGAGDAPGGTAAPAATAAPAPRADAARVTPAADAPGIVLLGDSLTAGLGLSEDDAYPAVLQRQVQAAGYPHRVVAAGVSGDTSAGGLRRVEWSLDDRSEILVVALGGNDGLRGLPPEQLEANLGAIIAEGQRRGLTVILAGMEAPPNFGDDYTARFRQVYRDLAAEYEVALIPFLLDGVGGLPEMNQRDGIHPNERGAEVLADTVWRAVKPALEASRNRRP